MSFFSSSSCDCYCELHHTTSSSFLKFISIVDWPLAGHLKTTITKKRERKKESFCSFLFLYVMSLNRLLSIEVVIQCSAVKIRSNSQIKTVSNQPFKCSTDMRTKWLKRKFSRFVRSFICSFSAISWKRLLYVSISYTIVVCFVCVCQSELNIVHITHASRAQNEETRIDGIEWFVKWCEMDFSDGSQPTTHYYN